MFITGMSEVEERNSRIIDCRIFRGDAEGWRRTEIGVWVNAIA